MTGATNTCKRSTARASIKFEIVPAPPSISTRLRPISARASTMARGEIFPSWLGRRKISSPGGAGWSQDWMRMVRTLRSAMQFR